MFNIERGNSNKFKVSIVSVIFIGCYICWERDSMFFIVISISVCIIGNVFLLSNV